MRSGTIVFLVACFCLAFSLGAEPENILVDKYTFNRPKDWKWRAPGDSWSALSRFQISDDGAKFPTEARFYIINSDKADLRKRVLSNFRKDAAEREERVKVGEFEITYFTAVGTAVDKETKGDPRPDQQFTGLFLPTESADKKVFIRLFGPRPTVERAFGEFKKMIEQAVRDGG